MDTGTAQMTKVQKVCAIITQGPEDDYEDDSLRARSMATIRRAADLVDSVLGGWS